jgi:hypothetical protein
MEIVKLPLDRVRPGIGPRKLRPALVAADRQQRRRARRAWVITSADQARAIPPSSRPARLREAREPPGDRARRQRRVAAQRYKADRAIAALKAAWDYTRSK